MEDALLANSLSAWYSVAFLYSLGTLPRDDTAHCGLLTTKN